MPDDDFTPLPDPRRRADPLKGRGTATRLAHRFDARDRVSDGEAPAFMADGDAELPPLRTEVTPEQARSILTHNDSPDIPFSQALNPYRGCEHGCIYCYARPTHSYLNLSPGLDFETRLVAKVNAAERLSAALQKPAYVCSPINLGSATDVYQPIEREWRLTRAVLEVLDTCHHPFTLVTKSAGVLRDLDLLARAAERHLCYVMVSVTTLDGRLSRILEPRAAAPWARLDAVRQLADAGVPVGVNVAPVIPGLTDSEIPAILKAAAAAGASFAGHTVLRLPHSVKELFEKWLEEHFPARKAKVLHRIRGVRGGSLSDPRFGSRMTGEGVYAEQIAALFELSRKKAKLSGDPPPLSAAAFRPPPGPQLTLF